MKYYDSVMEGIGIIAHNLTFYAEWEHIYANRGSGSNAEKQFREALISLYALILRYQAHVIHYFEKNRLSRIGKGALSGTFEVLYWQHI